MPWDRAAKEAWDKNSFALIASDGMGIGCVLETGGPAVAMLMNDVGNCLDDLGFCRAPKGLSIWEGRYRVYMDDYHGAEEGELVGDFRPLTADEWETLKNRNSLWNGEDWPKEDNP